MSATEESMREALDSAFEESEEKDDVEETEELDTELEEEETAPDSDDAEKSSEGEEKEEEEDPEEEKEDEPDTEAEKKVGDVPESSFKAPASWKPGAREKWKDIPVEMQEEITRREGEMEQFGQDNARARKIANEYVDLVEPYRALIAGAGSTPFQAVDNMMKTAAMLTVGTPQQKAQTAADIIKNYAIDIQQLDSLLAGEDIPDSETAKFGQMLDQRLAPVTNFMRSIETQRTSGHATTQASIDAEVDTFATKNEFYEDVREEMADMMEVAAKRGQEMTLATAYERTTAFHPEIGPIVAQRKAAASAAETNKKVRRKRRAGSSITGAPGAKSSDNPGSMRGAIQLAIDDLSEGV